MSNFIPALSNVEIRVTHLSACLIIKYARLGCDVGTSFMCTVGMRKTISLIIKTALDRVVIIINNDNMKETDGK